MRCLTLCLFLRTSFEVVISLSLLITVSTHYAAQRRAHLGGVLYSAKWQAVQCSTGHLLLATNLLKLLSTVHYVHRLGESVQPLLLLATNYHF